MAIRSSTCLVAAVASMGLAGAVQANMLINGGFEDPITYDGPPFVGFWEGFASGLPNSGVGNNSVAPRNGAQHAELNILGDDNSFTGVFQDVAGLSAGQMIVFGGFHATPSSPLDVGVEIRIEWRDSVADVEITRTPNLTVAPSRVYSEFMLPSTVPAGADSARVVYAIQTFGGDGPTNSGTVYLDDLYFIPAPSALALLGVAGLGLTRRRR